MAQRAKPAPRKRAPTSSVAGPAARLATLVDLWCASRAREVAVLAHRASAIAARDRESITGTDHAELHASWLAVESKRDPVDLDRLLATLTAGRCEQAIARLAKLAKRPADPRIVEKIVSIIESDPRWRRGSISPIPFTSQPNRPFWNGLLAMLEARGDSTIVPRLRAVVARGIGSGFDEWLVAKLAKLIPKLENRTEVALTAAQQHEIAAIAKQIERDEAAEQPAGERSDALFAAVWAAPDDDAPRHVLADFLSERGDPRGEFIALQLARHAGTLDAAGKKREKELLKRHKKQWLGPIAPLIQPRNLRFERGFLVTCQLQPNYELEKTLGTHPAWSTIREYLFHGYATAKGDGRELVALLESYGATPVVDRKWARGIE